MNRRALLKTPILAAVAGLCPAFLRKCLGFTKPERPFRDAEIRQYVLTTGKYPNSVPRIELEGDRLYSDALGSRSALRPSWMALERLKTSNRVSGVIAFDESEATIRATRGWNWLAFLKAFWRHGQPDDIRSDLIYDVLLYDKHREACLRVGSFGVREAPPMDQRREKGDLIVPSMAWVGFIGGNPLELP